MLALRDAQTADELLVPLPLSSLLFLSLYPSGSTVINLLAFAPMHLRWNNNSKPQSLPEAQPQEDWVSTMGGTRGAEMLAHLR